MKQALSHAALVAVASLAGVIWPAAVTAQVSSPKVQAKREHQFHLGPGDGTGDETAFTERAQVGKREPKEDELEETEPGSDGMVSDMKRDLRGTVTKIKKTNPKQIARKEKDDMSRTFFPGTGENAYSLMISLTCIPLGIAWMVLFFAFYYQHDHAEPMGLQIDKVAAAGVAEQAVGADVEEPSEVSETGKYITPDLVIVFAHPDDEHSGDADTLVNKSMLERMRFSEKMKQVANATHRAHQQSLSVVAAALEAAVEGDTEEAKATTMREVRIALLQDLMVITEDMGFHHTLFQSRDRDEIFFCLTLETANAEAMNHYAMKNNLFLQMRPEVVRKMGIDQPTEMSDPTHSSSSPPFIKFEPAFAESLSKEVSMLGQDLHVKIRWCKGLKNVQKLSGQTDPYCVCKIPGKAQSVFKTQVINNTTDPVWEAEGNIEWYKEGDSLIISVFDEDMAVIKEDELLGEVSLESKAFHPNGLDTVLTLGSCPEGVAPELSVQIEVVGVQQRILESPDVRNLYRTYHAKDPRGIVISQKESIHIIHKELEQLFDLDAAKHNGLLVNWYVAHNQKRIAQLEGCWTNWFETRDPYFKQPVPLLRNYFGTRVAFIIGWSGHYSKATLALLPLALVEFVVMTVYNDDPLVKRRMVLSYSVILIFWQHLTAQLWEREQGYLIKLWGMDVQEDKESIRPSFHGTKQPSQADRNMEDIVYPKGKSAALRLLTSFITILFCLFAFTSMVTWINIWDGQMSLVANIFLTIMIKVFELVYNAVVPYLIDWENHKYQSTYVDSYIWKQFSFQFVNCYGAFMYLAAKQRYTKAGCPPEGCLTLLRWQLIIALCILTVLRGAQVLLKCVLVKWAIESENRKMAKEAETKGLSPPRKEGFVERQAKLPPYRFREQIEDMLQMVIALGYVLLFGAVAPSIVVFCLAVFFVQLSTNAFLLLHFTQRSLPRVQNGVGAWRDVVILLNVAGVLFSAFLFAAESDTFMSAPMITKLTGFIVYCFLAVLFMKLIDACGVAWVSGGDIVILTERRRRVQDRLQELLTSTRDADGNRSHRRSVLASRKFSTTSIVLTKRATLGQFNSHELGGAPAEAWSSLPFVMEDGSIVFDPSPERSDRK